MHVKLDMVDIYPWQKIICSTNFMSEQLLSTDFANTCLKVHMCMEKGESFPNLHGQLDVTGLAFQIYDAPSGFWVSCLSALESLNQAIFYDLPHSSYSYPAIICAELSATTLTSSTSNFRYFLLVTCESCGSFVLE